MLLAAVAFAAKYAPRASESCVRVEANTRMLMFCDALTRCSQRDVGRNDNLSKKENFLAPHACKQQGD